MIQIKKVLNSSVVLIDNQGQVMIALGKGIGFGKKAGEKIDDSDIDQVFLPITETKSSQFAALVDEIPLRYFEMTKDIVQLAENYLPYTLNSTIYLTLSDHLHFAVERQQKGLSVTNRLYWEIKNYYAAEFEVAEKAMALLAENYQIVLPAEEASNIAFHLINAQSGNEENQDGLRKAKLISTIVNLVRYAIQQDVNTNSIHYSRFITHVRFFADRFFLDELTHETDEGLYRQMWALYPNAMDIATKVKAFLDQEFETKIPENEIVFLGVHINRLMNHSAIDK